MNFSEWSNQKKKKKQGNETSNHSDSSGTNTSVTTEKKQSFSEWSRERNETISLPAWGNSANTLLKELEQEFSKDGMATEASSSRLFRLLEQTDEFRSKYTGKTDVLAYIDSVEESLKGALTVAQKASYRDYWGKQFEGITKTLEEYGTKINEGAYLSNDELDAYTKAAQDYITIGGKLFTEENGYYQATINKFQRSHPHIASNVANVKDMYDAFYEASANDNEEDWNFWYARKTPEERLALYESYQEELKTATGERAEFLKSEIANYERGNVNKNGLYYGNKIVDTYYPITQRSDFAKTSANRDFANPTMEEIMKVDAMNDNSTWRWDYTDSPSGVYVDAFGNKLAVDENHTVYNPATQNFKVADKLGLYLNTSEDYRFEAMDVHYREGIWKSTMLEGYNGAWEELTEDELGIYYTLLAESQEKAYQFLDVMEITLNQRRTMKQQGQWKESYENAGWFGKTMMNLWSVPANVLGGASAFLSDTIDTWQGKEINPYSLSHSGIHYANTVRGATAEDLDGIGFDWFDLADVYQSGMAMADSVFASTIGGKFGGALLATGAAENEAIRLYKSGASKDQVLWGAATAGAAELVFESLSIGNLQKIKNMSNPVRGQFIKALLVQGGVEASEEMLTNISNTISNAIIMGSQSDWAALVEENDGKIGGALKDKFFEVLHDGIAGAISGSGSATLVGGPAALAQNAEYRNAGRSIIGAKGGVKALKTLAMDVAGATEGKTAKRITKMSDDATSYVHKGEGIVGKLKAWRANRANALNVGRLASEVDTANRVANTAANKADIVKSLQEKGFDEAKANEIASALVTAYNGQELSGKQERLLRSVENNEDVQDVVDRIISNDMSTMGQRQQGVRSYNEAVNTVNKLNQTLPDGGKLTVDGYKAILEAAGVKTWGGETAEDVDAVAAESGTETAPRAIETTAPASDGQVTGKLLVSDDGSTRDKNGDPISITGVASVKDGKLVLMTESGTIDVKDVQFANEDVANVYDAISQMDVTPEAAWELVSTYKHSDGISSEDFASDIQLAYRYGRKNFKNGLKNLKLTKEQADTAFRLGRKAAEAAVKTTKQAGSDGTVSDNNSGKKILFEGFTYNEQTANDVQKASMEAIDTINKLSSLEVHVFKSYKKKDGKLYALVDSKERLAPNGYFTDGNKIYIDLNAGNMGEGVMLYTMAHEIGHYIAQWNAEDFQAISDFLFAHYGEDVPIYDLLETQKAKLRESYKRDGKAIPSEAQLEKLAHEELVCDMLSRMLADKNAYDKLMELKQKDLNLFQKLGRAIKKLLDKLAKSIGIYDKYTPDFKYAASVETFGEEAFRQLQDLYVKAFVQADANFQAAGKNTTEDVSVMFMVRENTEIPYKQYCKLINKKPIKDSRKYFAKVKDARIDQYRTLSEEDIPDIDFLEIAEYNKVDEGYVYTIRNYDKFNFAILSRKAIKTKYDGYVMEVASNGKTGETTGERNDGKGSQHRGNEAGNRLPGDQGAIRGNAGRSQESDNVDQKQRLSDGDSDNGRIGIENSNGSTASTEAMDVELDTKTESVSPAVMNSERDFTYQELTARNPLQGRIIDKNRTVKLTNNGSIDKGWVVAEVLKQCESIQTKAPLPTYYVNIPDIGKNVEITSKPIEHGFIKSEVKNGKPVPPRSMINARASLDLPHILQNSIEVNRSDRGDNAQVEFSHVLIGVTAMESANGTIEYYAVRSVVEARKNQGAILTEANVIGKLHAMNAKKIGKPHAQAGGNSTALTSSSLFGYNVADLLNDVKNDFADTFSDDVYKHFGMTREYNERFSKYLLFSERTEDSVSNRSLLATAFEGVAQDEFEKNKIQEYKEKIELLDAQEHKLHELNKQIKELSFSKGPRDTQKLKKLRSEATKTANRINIYDSQLLRLEASKPLQRVLLRERKKAYDRAVKRGKEKLSEYRETFAKKQVKHKIQRVVKELKDLLLSDDKKRHVPDSLKKAVAGALDILNLDTSNTEERAAKYEKLIAEETDPDKIDAYQVTLDNILRAGEKMGEKLGQLHSAYQAIANSTDPDIQGGYDATIANAIQELSETIGTTPISKMSMEQLEDVYNVYKAVLTRVRDANKSLIESARASIADRSHAAMAQVKKAGGEHYHRAAAMDAVKKASWDNEKPVYAFERIGSDSLTEAYNNVQKGESIWAVDVSEAAAFFEKLSKEHNYDSWDFDKKYTFTATSGKKFQLTLQQMMSLYAYSKRAQADEHLRLGGFVFDSNIEEHKEEVDEKTGKTKKSILKYKVNTAAALQIDLDTMGEIVNALSEIPGVKDFVDAMQDYLSTTMGAKGNEVTMRMYGIKLFKEKYYFPLKSAKQFLFEKNEVAGEIRIKNSGFTNKTVQHANNPIILSNFMDVWADHVNDMSMYHAFTLPLEDFNRIFNYKNSAAEGSDSESVKSVLQSAYGPAAVNYIQQLIKDLNGGAVSDPRETTGKKMMSLWKKAKVMASLSVVVQQPTSLVRAFALVDPKYFRPTKDGMTHKELWEQLKTYAPVAIIKEMGGFDTGSGVGARDFIQGKQNRLDKVLGWAPAKADEVTWCAIWNAVKRETLARHTAVKPNTEEHLKLAGDRFTEVIAKTQVYDSVLSKSANMRSKSGLMNMVTAFMAEPTTTINMMEDAIRKGLRGNKKYAARATASVVVCIIVNNIASSFIYAARDDDEEETYIEKYAQAFVSGMIDDVNPLTYYPWLKDAWSLLKGYDVGRSDMNILSEAMNAAKGLYKAYEKEENIAGAWMDIAGAFANLIGIPLDNVRREIEAGFNTWNTLKQDFTSRDTTWGSLGDAIGESTRENVPIYGWGAGASKTDNLYDAVVSGDEKYEERFRDSYVDKNGNFDQSKYNTALKKAIRENDPRIQEAAEARIDGNFARYKELVQEIQGEDNFGFEIIRDAVLAEEKAILKKRGLVEDTEDSAEEDSYSTTFKVSDFYRAVADGDQKEMDMIYQDILSDKLADNYLEHEAKDAIASAFATEVGKHYMDGEITRDQAVKMLNDHTDKGESDVKKWDFEKEYGFPWSSRVRKYRGGKISERDLVQWVMDIEGEDRAGAQAYIDFLDLEKANPTVDITASDAESFFMHAEPAGIDIETYLGFKSKASGITGDKDPKTGKVKSGSKKKKVVDLIHSLKLSRSQKDALYRAQGYAENDLKDTPWH